MAKLCPYGILKRYGNGIDRVLFCKENGMSPCIYIRRCAECGSVKMLPLWEKCYDRVKEKKDR